MARFVKTGYLEITKNDRKERIKVKEDRNKGKAITQEDEMQKEKINRKSYNLEILKIKKRTKY